MVFSRILRYHRKTLASKELRRLNSAVALRRFIALLRNLSPVRKAATRKVLKNAAQCLMCLKSNKLLANDLNELSLAILKC